MRVLEHGRLLVHAPALEPRTQSGIASRAHARQRLPCTRDCSPRACDRGSPGWPRLRGSTTGRARRRRRNAGGRGAGGRRGHHDRRRRRHHDRCRRGHHDRRRRGYHDRRRRGHHHRCRCGHHDRCRRGRPHAADRARLRTQEEAPSAAGTRDHRGLRLPRRRDRGGRQAARQVHARLPGPQPGRHRHAVHPRSLRPPLPRSRHDHRSHPLEPHAGDRQEVQAGRHARPRQRTLGARWQRRPGRRSHHPRRSAARAHEAPHRRPPRAVPRVPPELWSAAPGPAGVHVGPGHAGQQRQLRRSIRRPALRRRRARRHLRALAVRDQAVPVPRRQGS